MFDLVDLQVNFVVNVVIPMDNHDDCIYFELDKAIDLPKQE
jgi:hypothetical protein